MFCSVFRRGLFAFSRRYSANLGCKMSARSEGRMVEEQDDLDYNITFPTPTGDEDPDMKEPVVYILGWAGSTDKLLAKYSAIYESEGCITLRYTLPNDDVFFFSNSSIPRLQDTSQKLVQLLDDYELRENPVIFHVLSNAGAMLYRWSAEAFLKENINIIGAVLDSCPSRLTLVVGLKAAYYVERPNGLLSFLSYAGRFFINSFTSVVTLSYDPRFDPYDAIRSSESNRWPHLFLYSTNDGMIPSQDVLDVVKGRKSAGAVFVRTCNFETSQHISHFKEQKERYTEECTQFLDDCLRIDDGEELPIDQNGGQISSVDPEVTEPYSDLPSTSGKRSSSRLRRTSQNETNI